MHKTKVIMVLFGVAWTMFISCSTVAFGFTISKPSKGNQFISNIAETDRSDFLNYELISAVRKYNRSDVQLIYGSKDVQNLNRMFDTKFKDVTVPFGFSKDLLQWVEGEAHNGKRLPRSPRSISRSPTRAICFAHGCVDVRDIGSVCCPF